VGGEFAVAGGLLYILMHGISKGGLFLCAGIVEHSCHTKDITKLGGLYKTMPVTAASFLLCALSVMGIPPFGGFFSKYMVVNGAVEAGHPWIAAVFLLGAVMTVIYLLRVFVKVFFGEPNMEHMPNEGSRIMVASVGFMALLSLISGFLISYPASMAVSAVQQMAEVIR
jgi:NADH:ubiquinone oxidoreductase subunit 5 (subunit L)/multisubunit Na+/H+ antiporter MnhA subunit